VFAKFNYFLFLFTLWYNMTGAHSW